MGQRHARTTAVLKHGETTMTRRTVRTPLSHSRLAAQGESDEQIAWRLATNPRAAAKLRQHHGIPSGTPGGRAVA
jgi:hypothetical protein